MDYMLRFKIFFFCTVFVSIWRLQLYDCLNNQMLNQNVVAMRSVDFIFNCLTSVSTCLARYQIKEAKNTVLLVTTNLVLPKQQDLATCDVCYCVLYPSLVLILNNCICCSSSRFYSSKYICRMDQFCMYSLISYCTIFIH